MGRNITLDIVDQIQIASPCHMRWEDMEGDERKRYCGECRLNVYNLSAMTRAEAADLIRRTEGRLCAGFFRRADGTVITRDCPVGLAARAGAATRRIAAALALALGAGLMIGATRGPVWRLRQVQPFATVCDWLRPPLPPPILAPVPGRLHVLGALSLPPIQPTTSPAVRVEQANGGKR